MFRLVLTVSQHHWVTRTKPVSLSYSNYIAVAQHKVCDVDLSFNVEVKLEQMMHLQSDKMHMKVTRASHACVWTVLVWDIKCLSQTLSKPSGGVSHCPTDTHSHTSLSLIKTNDMQRKEISMWEMNFIWHCINFLCILCILGGFSLVL